MNRSHMADTKRVMYKIGYYKPKPKSNKVQKITHKLKSNRTQLNRYTEQKSKQ